ncbi:MAG: hypothetical protein A2Z99_05445 [Treponema sp. GWB1_62_6]|nr:MAG: hypothetical protein A2Y36_15010 [Treponema sp. GWA1_62_8]OHE69309.1 MAG: hypothetical protein A2001_12555 [Treponema sp. GWC1_61_84]OHE70756.1 MAG: hypothetical protein A2Z99_05445 [Treponema sp. GWB1_62_6]OHE76738.1 MAG: hypothetical protein A2413_18740 [Treponema sp. RIFOXYC1_FULL_61_9]
MAAKEKKTIVAKDNTGMQELSRRYHANPFVFIGTVVILILTVVTFVLVPALAPKAGSGGGGKLAFGEYDGQSIDFVPGNFFAQQRDYYNQQIRSTGQNDNLQYAAFQVWRAAFESTVVRTAALSEMEKAGFKTPAVLVDRSLAEYPAFQENGRFSATRYRAMSDSDRLVLRDGLRDEIAQNRYMEDMLALTISAKEKEFMKSLASPERNFEFVAFPLTGYPDGEVAAFVSSKKDLFRAIRLSRITVASSEKDAQKVLESIKAGTTSFEDAAKTHSKDSLADKGGDMGIKLAYELDAEIPDEASRTAVLGLAKGDLSSIAKVPAGWAFFRCDEAARDSDAADAAFLKQARTYIERMERGRIEDWGVAQAAAFVDRAQAVGFDIAASALSLSKKSFGPVPINYGDTELYRSIASFKMNELAGASTNTAFLKAAFSAPVASVTKPLVLGNNVIVLKVVDEKTAEEASTSIIDFYYPYIAGQYSEKAVRNSILKSEKLNDRFYEVFIANFLPQQ